MHCTNCGRPLGDNAAACAFCGAAVQRFPARAAAASVPNHLIQSVLVTLCCCLPFGIVAIVYAAQVNTKLAAGDIAGAVQASNNARTWGWIAFLCGAIPSAIYIVLMLMGAVHS